MREDDILRFQVSAPGKVILHGEHSVVYGKPAIAAAIGRRNSLFFTEHSTNESGIIFSLQALNFVVKLEVDDFNTLLTNVTKSVSESNSAFEDCSTVLEILKKFINDRLLIVEQNDERKFKTLLAVLYVMCGILGAKKNEKIRRGFTLELMSEIRIGAGLGSSASFAVCITTAFLILARRGDRKADILSPESKGFISEWAFNSERIIHGKPSGIDNTVCTFGGIVKFTKGLPIQQINIRCSFNILLVDSKVNRNTANLVKKVSELRERFPKLIDSTLNLMGECAEEAAILYGNDASEEKGILQKLSDLFQVNNGLLRAIGVSHCKLEEIFSIAHKYGFASKLTGAGGGGYAIILLPYNYKASDEFKNLCCDLEKANFEWSEAIVGSSGVSVEFL